MRRMIAILALLSLAVSAAYPCGGKYVGRNAILNMPPAVRPASILILNNQSLRVYSKSLKSTLKQLGHSVQVVKNSDEVVMALKSGKYDIVMADVAAMGSLVKQFEATSPNVIAVPLLPKNTKKGAISSAEYPFAVKLSARSKAVRKTIEKAMESMEAKVVESKEKA